MNNSKELLKYIYEFLKKETDLELYDIRGYGKGGNFEIVNNKDEKHKLDFKNIVWNFGGRNNYGIQIEGWGGRNMFGISYADFTPMFAIIINDKLGDFNKFLEKGELPDLEYQPSYTVNSFFGNKSSEEFLYSNLKFDFKNKIINMVKLTLNEYYSIENDH